MLALLVVLCNNELKDERFCSPIELSLCTTGPLQDKIVLEFMLINFFIDLFVYLLDFSIICIVYRLAKNFLSYPFVPNAPFLYPQKT